MKIHGLFLTLIILASSLTVCLGQETNEILEGNNWINQNGLYPNLFISLRYDRYSKEDIVKFREKLDQLKTAEFKNEWDGIYRSGISEVEFSELRFDSNIGFIDFTIYTCFPELRYTDYGNVANGSGNVQFLPEFAADSPRKTKPAKFVKVKWDERYFLVEESSLSAFAEKAVGIYVEPERDSTEEGHRWLNHWVKGNFEKELVGLPEFPASYKSFQRFPIEAKIISVGKRTFEAEKSFIHKYGERFYYNVAVYPITLNGGKNKGVKKGMSFFSDQNVDEIYVTEVKENTAVGFVIRETDDNKNDVCYNAESSDLIPCPNLKTQLKIKTRVGDFGF